MCLHMILANNCFCARLKIHNQATHTMWKDFAEMPFGKKGPDSGECGETGTESGDFWSPGREGSSNYL